MESLDKHNSSPSFVRPFLYALNRMQANEILRPVQYMDRAKMLLIDRLGMSGPIPEAAFSHGVVGLMADHTHYFEGFALGLRLRQGVAVAIRSNDLQYHRLILEGTGDVQVSKEASYGDAELSSLLIHTIDALDGAGGRFFDVSIVGSIPTGLGASFVGALTVSLIRGLNTFDNVPSVESKVRVQALAALNAWYNNRFSPAYVIGSLSDQTEPYILIDTGTMSHLPIEAPVQETLGWGLVEWSKDWIHSYKGAKKRADTAKKALKDLQDNGFSRVESFRNLEHRDLERAIDSIQRRSRSALRFLVTENRNVQKLIVALKKGDWQFLGAIMMISQASKTTDWSTTDTIHNLITTEAETAALDGIFGVVQSGEGGCMLVCGQPFSLPAFLDRIRESASSHTKEDVETFII
jgi:galactokinase